MIIHDKKMINNLNLTKGIFFSQQVMLELTKNNLSREQAYRIVQKNAKVSLNKNISLLDSLKKDKVVIKKINQRKLNKIFDLSYHTKKINFIYKRIF